MSVEPTRPGFEVFRTTTLGDLVKHSRSAITVKSTDTVEQVLQVMDNENILSTPVISAKDGSVLGLVSVTDIMIPLVFHPNFKQGVEAKSESELSNAQFLSKLDTKIFDAPIESFLGVSAESKMRWSLAHRKGSDKLADLLEPFSKGVHRVLVHDADGKHKILSQSDVLNFLERHIDFFADMVDKSVTELGLLRPSFAVPGGESVVSMNMTESALSGFRKMYNGGFELSAVPILDRQDHLVATLSASDLRGLNRGNLPTLLLPVHRYLVAHLKQRVRPAVSCGPFDSFREVVEKISYARTHRVWVHDALHHVIGSISISDIICKFSPFDYKTPPAAVTLKPEGGA